MKKLTYLLLIILIAPAIFAESQGQELSHVILQLKWYHQFQFAGYYQAQKQGYYEAEGLEVEILAGGPSIKVDEEILSGRAHYGVLGSELIEKRAQGSPLVILSVIFQHSQRAIILREDTPFNSPTSLMGSTIMLNSNEIAEFHAMFHAEGTDMSLVDIIPKDSSANEQFINGTIDGLNGSIANQPFLFESKGIEVRTLRPINYGIDFYGDSLFTSETTVRKNALETEAFIRASLRGWEYALAHQEETAQLILDEYPSSKTMEALLFEAQEIEKLIQPEMVRLGHINPQRIERIAQLYSQAEVIPDSYDMTGFIYTPISGLPRESVKEILIILSLFLVIIVISLSALIFFNRQLKKRVNLKTKQLKESMEKEKIISEQLNRQSNLNALGRMAGGVAHSVNNILTVITSTAELLLFDHNTFNKEQRTMISSMISSCMHGAEFTEVLARFSRRTPPPMKPISLHEVVEEAITFLPSPGNINIVLSNNLLSPKDRILANFQAIQSCILNLLHNSVEAMDHSGEIKITSFLKEFSHNLMPHICTWTIDSGQYIALAVEDQGVGIPHDGLQKIFEPFFTTKEIALHKGLGLAELFLVMENHRGWIEVESTQGKGTVITLFFPLLDVDPTK